jgi:hypothetical protein
MMIFNVVVSMIGMLLVWQLDEDNQAGRMAGLTMGAVFAVNIPLSLSLISSNVAGFTKRSVTSALLFVAYCVGNIVGPQVFLDTEEPSYPVSWSLLLPLTAVHSRHILTGCIDWNEDSGLWISARRLFPCLPVSLLFI